MIRVNNISLPLDYDDKLLLTAAAKMAKIDEKEVFSLTLNRRSVDARRRGDVRFLASVNLWLKGEECEPFDDAPAPAANPERRIVVVGAGPAGLFCAYTLARAGMRPIVIERGEPTPQRIETVQRFWQGGELNEQSNVQFGEGGAGTFSDGKLNTGIKDTRIRSVLQGFVRFGAPDEILWQAKPHIGTDKLRSVVVNMRREIIRLGGELRCNSTLVDINTKDGAVRSVIIQSDVRYELPCDALVLCIGHSSRDTLQMLLERGVTMQQKPFAMGVRIEHTQDFINRAQYGSSAGHPALSPADYKLAVHPTDGRGVYSFCMCPGGYVVAASSERGGIVTNGMSNFTREGKNANSALLVGITPTDLEGEHPLSGVELQRSIEREAFRLTNSYNAPAQTLGSFLSGTQNKPSGVLPSYRPGVELCSLERVLPKIITDSLRCGIGLMNSKIRGFADPAALLTAPETRSSSPVRIVRDERLQASISGIYPCGEGAGYAGGITSSAVDGIKCAEMILK